MRRAAGTNDGYPWEGTEHDQELAYIYALRLGCRDVEPHPSNDGAFPEVTDRKEHTERTAGRRKEDAVVAAELVRHEKERRLWLGAYVMIVAVAVLGFVRTDVALDRANEATRAVSRESLARDYTQCERANEARQGIRAFIITVFGGDDDLSEGQQRVIELANEQFADLTCPPEPQFEK